MKRTVKRAVRPRKTITDADTASTFDEIVDLIKGAQQRAFSSVNSILVDLYWNVGKYISDKIASAQWGEGIVTALASHIQLRLPNLRGFTRANLFRMRQFYETYRDDKKVAALLRQLPWTHHMIIIGRSKQPEERRFYLQMAIKERWSSRQLERQFRTSLFERAVLAPPIVAPLLCSMLTLMKTDRLILKARQKHLCERTIFSAW